MRAGCWVVFPMLLLVTPLWSQQGVERDSIHFRDTCRQAAHLLEQGSSHPRYEWARLSILTCSDEAPPILLRLWQRVEPDTARVQYLVSASQRFRDSRLYENARGTALDRTRPHLVRLGAMVLLHRYADPSSAISIVESALHPRSGRRVRYLFAKGLHNVQVPGPEPIPGPVVVPVLELLRQIGASDDHENITFAARVLARTLEVDMEQVVCSPDTWGR